MDVISAYREVGSYRGAAAMCGTTPKTVRRIIERHENGGGRPVRGRRARNYDSVAELVAGRVKATSGRISAKRLLPVARAAGYDGSPRNFRRLVAEARADWRVGHHRGRRPAVWAPGEALAIDWGVLGGLHVVLRGAGLVTGPVRPVRRGRAGGHDVRVAGYRLLCEEVRISCTYGMLLCLSWPVRAAYLLGDVLGAPDTAGAAICEITPAAFRQRVSRARRTIRQVIDNRCGLVNPANPCRCGRQIEGGLAAGILDRDNLTFARHPRELAATPAVGWLEPAAAQLDLAVAIGELYRADRFAAPGDMWAQVQQACPDLLAAPNGAAGG